jgi:hypothetical protein
MDYLDIAVRKWSKAPREVSARWVEWFLGLQILCQLALLVSFIGPFRLPIRITSFAASLAMLAIIRRRGIRHPAQTAVIWVLAILAVGLLHPTTNTLLAGAAQVTLNFAIVAPLFWVTRLPLDLSRLRRLLFVLWMFHCLSSVVGILQTYFPGRFQPTLSQIHQRRSDEALESLMITTADGEQVYRPMGLTDNPGGAATAGFYAVLLGVGFYLFTSSRVMRLFCLGSMVIGLSCILLSQVRSVLVMLCCCLAVLMFLLARRRESAKVISVATALFGIALLGFGLAVGLAGTSVTNRLETLIADKPLEVYHKNRGHFLVETVTKILPEFPLGAGLGRWGMVNAYFGDNSNPDRAPIWVEIQWTGWVLDGGLPLVIAYVSAIILTTSLALKLALSPRAGPLWIWASVIAAYDIGALAVMFNYPLFIGQGGVEFWLLNAALFTVAYRQAAGRTNQINATSSVGRWRFRQDGGDGHGELRPSPVSGAARI